jgi:tetratricopeptide (TPR) repeat protein
MKFFQISAFVLLVLTSTQVNGQCKAIKQALKALNNGDVDSSIASLKIAEALIVENSLETVSDKCMAKYYYTKAASHLMTGQKEDSLEIKIDYFNISKQHYEKYLALKKATDLDDIVQSNLQSLAIEYSNIGVEYYELKNYELGLKFMQKGIALKRQHQPDKIKDTDLFNALVCAKMFGNYEQANSYADSLLSKENLTKVNKIKYIGQKIEVLTAAQKLEDALNWIDSLKIINPNDPNVKLAELQIYLDQEMNEKALVTINELTQEIKNREDLWVIKGQLHYQIDQEDSSVQSFSNALMLNEKNYSALYGLGVIYVNKGNRHIQKMKQSSGQKKLEHEENIKIEFGVAIGYLRKILEIKPRDINSLIALKKIYHSLADVSNEKLIDELISKLKG